MKLEHQVCSLELAKRLKELGVKQESYFYWAEAGFRPEMRVIPADFFMCDCESEEGSHSGCDLREIAAETVGGPGKYDPNAAYSAFTVAELGEMLPKYLGEDKGFLLQMSPKDGTPSWNVGYMKWNEDLRTLRRKED